MTAFEENVFGVITSNYLHTCARICKITDIPTHTYTNAHTHTYTHTHTHILKMCAFDSFLNSKVCLEPQGSEHNFKIVVILVTLVITCKRVSSYQ